MSLCMGGSLGKGYVLESEVAGGCFLLEEVFVIALLAAQHRH